MMEKKMNRKPRVFVMDALPESALKYNSDFAVIAVDVIRSMTVAVTALSKGQKVFPVGSLEEAWEKARGLESPLMVGEQAGVTPEGFDLTNSPVKADEWRDPSRPMVLLSSAGTLLMKKAGGAERVYAGCFRNLSAVAAYAAEKHSSIAVIEAGTRGERRIEDQIAAAKIGDLLMKRGFSPLEKGSADYVREYRDRPLEDIRGGNSAKYLAATGQTPDLDFTLEHIDDLNLVAALVNGELCPLVQPENEKQPGGFLGVKP